MTFKIPFAGMLRKLLMHNSEHLHLTDNSIASLLSPVNNSHHCCMLLGVVVQILKFEAGQTFKSTSPNISFVCVQRRVAQQCWICLHSSSNIF